MGILKPKLPVVADIPVQTDKGIRAVACDDSRIDNRLLRLAEIFRSLRTDNELAQRNGEVGS